MRARDDAPVRERRRLEARRRGHHRVERLEDAREGRDGLEPVPVALRLEALVHRRLVRVDLGGAGGGQASALVLFLCSLAPAHLRSQLVRCNARIRVRALQLSEKAQSALRGLDLLKAELGGGADNGDLHSGYGSRGSYSLSTCFVRSEPLTCCRVSGTRSPDQVRFVPPSDGGMRSVASRTTPSSSTCREVLVVIVSSRRKHQGWGFAPLPQAPGRAGGQGVPAARKRHPGQGPAGQTPQAWRAGR